MPRTCKACSSQKREEIDRALIAGEPFRRIAAQYGLSATGLRRHKKDHLQAIVGQALEQEHERRIITAQEVWEIVSLLCLYDPLDWHNEWGAFRDMREIPWEARMAIQSEKRREIYNQEDKDGQKSVIGETREYKAVSRLEALKLAAQLHQMLKPPEVQQNEFNIFLMKSKDELDYFIKNHCWPPPAADVTAEPIPVGKTGD